MKLKGHLWRLLIASSIGFWLVASSPLTLHGRHREMVEAQGDNQSSAKPINVWCLLIPPARSTTLGFLRHDRRRLFEFWTEVSQGQNLCRDSM